MKICITLNQILLRLLLIGEQLRIQAAIAAMQGILANHLIIRYNDAYTIKESYLNEDSAARRAVGYADALIEELKKDTI